jgi:polyisoprenoid-binding protein YceI
MSLQYADLERPSSDATPQVGATGPVPAGTWNVDPERSEVGFALRAMRFTTARGRFSEVEGTLRGGAGRLLATSIVQTGSIDTGIAKRDGHLSSPDFFDAENHPEITLTATSAEPRADGTYRVPAELSMKGTTRPVELTIDAHEEADDRLRLHATGRIHRYDYGVKAPTALLEAGGFMIGREIDLDLRIEASRA